MTYLDTVVGLDVQPESLETIDRQIAEVKSALDSWRNQCKLASKVGNTDEASDAWIRARWNAAVLFRLYRQRERARAASQGYLDTTVPESDGTGLGQADSAGQSANVPAGPQRTPFASDTIQLFDVTSVLEESPFAPYPIVIHWLFDEIRGGGRPQRLPYPRLIARYGRLRRADRIYMEGAVGELLTKSEATEVAIYLANHHGLEVKMTEIELPLKEITVGCGGSSLGGPIDAYLLWKEDEYNLPYKVYGWFDVRACPSTEA